jgi:guanylate kinase
MVATPGKLFILAAPSGGGKTSLAQALIEASPSIVRSVSHTTRAPRPGERDGVDYFFVAPGEFERLAAAGEFLEHATVFGNRYGTSRRAVEARLAAGQNVLLTIDWQGARSIKRQLPQACSIFILPPSRQALEERLRARGQDSEEVIAARMHAALSEISHYDEFDVVVVNDDFSAALEDLKAVILGDGTPKRPLNVDIAGLLAGY